MATSAATTKNAKLFAINNLAFGLQSTSRLERRGQLPNPLDFPEGNKGFQERAAEIGAAAERTGLPDADVSSLLDSGPYPDLRHIVQAWPYLPPHIREAVVTVVNSAASSIPEGARP